ncbi:unnamed protein product [Cladocopium goreaui]|uniref:Uncharacterized protein n=1 Tax=Cladocopium goreaui TaxID=2562237 RepID=A0A9P1CFZ7_9DINO|nr:unnamed protein product [Cladocopium goreaui]
MPSRHRKTKKHSEKNAGATLCPWLPLMLASAMCFSPLNMSDKPKNKQKIKNRSKQDLPITGESGHEAVPGQVQPESEPAEQTFFQPDVPVPDKSVDKTVRRIEAKFKQSSAGVSLADFHHDRPAGRCKCVGHFAQVQQYIRDFLAFDASSNGGASSEWTRLLAAAYPGLSQCTLESMLFWIVERAITAMEEGSAHLDFVEYACGRGNLSKALLRKNFAGVGLDILWSACHDCLQPAGLLLWLECLQALRPNSLVWFGTKCSSWVSLCVSCSRRSAENMYHGDCDRPFVVEGNRLMMVTSLLYFLASCLGHFTTLEQPQSSTMVKNPWLQNVLVWVQAQKFTTYMGAFGASTCKPVQLWSTRSLDALLRDKPSNSDESLASRDENGGYSGVQPALQESEVYPELFGVAVSNCFVQKRA